MISPLGEDQPVERHYGKRVGTASPNQPAQRLPNMRSARGRRERQSTTALSSLAGDSAAGRAGEWRAAHNHRRNDPRYGPEEREQATASPLTRPQRWDGASRSMLRKVNREVATPLRSGRPIECDQCSVLPIVRWTEILVVSRLLVVSTLLQCLSSSDPCCGFWPRAVEPSSCVVFLASPRRRDPGTLPCSGAPSPSARQAMIGKSEFSSLSCTLHSKCFVQTFRQSSRG